MLTRDVFGAYLRVDNYKRTSSRVFQQLTIAKENPGNKVYER